MAARATPGGRARRLVAVVVIAVLLLGFPVLAVIEALDRLSPVPLVPLWLALVWAGLILATRRLVSPARGRRP